jgi:hypothetical protein
MLLHTESSGYIHTGLLTVTDVVMMPLVKVQDYEVQSLWLEPAAVHYSQDKFSACSWAVVANIQGSSILYEVFIRT